MEYKSSKVNATRIRAVFDTDCGHNGGILPRAEVNSNSLDSGSSG